MTVADRSSWGSDPAGANDAPAWNYINNEFRGTANVVSATPSGWAIQHPWGPGGSNVAEVVVAIGELANTAVYGSFGVVRYSSLLAAPGHSNNEHIKVLVQLNAGAVCFDANTANVYIAAIALDGNAAPSTNVNLLYKPLLSDPGAGELVFEAVAVDLSLEGTGGQLVINSSAVLHGAGGVFKAAEHHYTLLLTGSLTINIA